jgi:hypothetical protein
MRGNAERLDLRVCWGIHGRHYTFSASSAEMIGEFLKTKKPGEPGFFSFLQQQEC